MAKLCRVYPADGGVPYDAYLDDKGMEAVIGGSVENKTVKNWYEEEFYGGTVTIWLQISMDDGAHMKEPKPPVNPYDFTKTRLGNLVLSVSAEYERDDEVNEDNYIQLGRFEDYTDLFTTEVADKIISQPHTVSFGSLTRNVKGLKKNVYIAALQLAAEKAQLAADKAMQLNARLLDEMRRNN